MRTRYYYIDLCLYTHILTYCLLAYEELQAIQFSQDDPERVILAGGHQILAKRVSVNAIKVTFTNDNEAFSNPVFDECPVTNRDRTAVIDMLNVSESSNYNNEYKDRHKNDLSLPECPDRVGNDPNNQKHNPCFVNIENGATRHQDCKSVLNTENNLQNKPGIKSTNHVTILTTNDCNIPPKRPTLSERPEYMEMKSLTLNHKYDDEEKRVEQNMYRYEGLTTSLHKRVRSVTKSTLV